MHLRRVEVEGFRGIPKLSATFAAGLNVLVGRNSVGKTALLDAIRLGLGPNASPGEAVWVSRDDFHVAHGMGPSDPPAGPIRIELEFAGATKEQVGDFLDLAEIDPQAPEKSKLKVHFEATWDEHKKRAQTKRWGGARDGDRPPVEGVLGEIPVTFLQALRDANLALQPGRANRLARLIEHRIRDEPEKRKQLEDVFATANKGLDEHELVQELASQIQSIAEEASGTDYVGFRVGATQNDYQRILRTLRLFMSEGLPDVSSAGLGYSNILYMATVLAQLEGEASEGAPLLLIEEPEAHLHPQLTQLLARYLAGRAASAPNLQIIATSHSPTFASQVRPSQIVAMSATRPASVIRCNHLREIGLEPHEEDELQRMMDVTKSTLYFAKGFILVEGICEALLLPELAKKVDPKYDLAALHVSVIPITGVSFGAFRKVLSDNGVAVPVAIVTDADPDVIKGSTWAEDLPTKEGAGFALSDRTKKLHEIMKDNAPVKVCHSQVTLEYDLAQAGPNNAIIMAEAWESLYDGKPKNFNVAKVNAAADDSEKALIAWRGICRAHSQVSKAEFAQRLARRMRDDGAAFAVPPYLAEAIQHVCKPLLP